MWGLPGGFVYKTSRPTAGQRVLQERTGLQEIFPAIPYVRRHGAVRQGVSQPRSQKDGITVQSDHWLLQRFVTIGYYALVEFSKVSPSEDTLTESACGGISGKFFLMLDHKDPRQSAANPPDATQLSAHWL